MKNRDFLFPLLLRSVFVAVSALIAVLSMAGSAKAATQGSLGATSTGTAVITVVIPAQFKIGGINNFALGGYSGSGSMAANQDICVYTNGSGSYKVLVTDDTSMTPTGFSVQNGIATSSIPYKAYWNNTTGTAGSTQLSYNSPLLRTGANVLSTNCSVGGKSANIEVVFAQADLRKGVTGGYSGTMTIVIEP